MIEYKEKDIDAAYDKGVKLGLYEMAYFICSSENYEDTEKAAKEWIEYYLESK
jgi:hypothetical protein